MTEARYHELLRGCSTAESRRLTPTSFAAASRPSKRGSGTSANT